MRQCCCRRPGALAIVASWHWFLLPPLFRLRISLRSSHSLIPHLRPPRPHPPPPPPHSPSIACIAHPRVYHYPVAKFGYHHQQQQPHYS
ncbi:hypothetical protein CGRA01v4_04193 [Colletotrichum graminicola]|nr:hypothetical protein CGRA01v4_04193 [Colletotrichum graminicola]